MLCAREARQATKMVIIIVQLKRAAKAQKVLAKQKQRIKSTTTIASGIRTVAIDFGRRIDPGARFPAPGGLPEEGTHNNPWTVVDSD